MVGDVLLVFKVGFEQLLHDFGLHLWRLSLPQLDQPVRVTLCSVSVSWRSSPGELSTVLPVRPPNLKLMPTSLPIMLSLCCIICVLWAPKRLAYRSCLSSPS